MLNEFTFAARFTSVFSGFRRVVLQFSLADELNGAVKVDPRFFLLSTQDGSSVHLSHVTVERAWLLPFGVFLFLGQSKIFKNRVLFVSMLSPQFISLKAVLNRLRAVELFDRPSLTNYFWRMNVLR